MNEDPPELELWVLVAEAAFVLAGAWLWGGSNSPAGEFVASWALTAALLAFVAGAIVPLTRGVQSGVRALFVTGILAASGGLLTALTMTSILLLNVVRTGLSASAEDIWRAALVGVPAGSWVGMVAGLLSGLTLMGCVLLVERRWPVAPSPDRPSHRWILVALGGVGLVACAIAEVQHWAPLSTLTGCIADCAAWSVRPLGRVLGSALFISGLVGAGHLFASSRVSRVRGGAGVAVMGFALVFLGLGHTHYASTKGPRFRRAIVGLPEMHLPLQGQLVNAEVIERPGWLFHSVEVRWQNGRSESILLGLGPFRPRMRPVVGAMQATAAAWQRDAMPGRRELRVDQE